MADAQDRRLPASERKIRKARAEGTLSVSDALREYAAELDAPFCGPNANFEAAGWFEDATPHIRSVADGYAAATLDVLEVSHGLFQPSVTATETAANCVKMVIRTSKSK